MLYKAYEARRRLSTPVWGAAEAQSRLLRALPTGLATTSAVRAGLAMSELVATLKPTHRRPRFGIDSVVMAGEPVAVTEHAVHSTPFGTLLHFAKDTDVAQPRVLVVAALSGHFATLLRETVRTLLPDHDVYITDWHNARDIPRSAGRFGQDEYIEHVMSFLADVGPGAHLVAVCQPCPHALAAAALMAEDDHPAQPLSITLMAGPVDTRVNPGRVHDMAGKRSLDWFERTVVTTVPRPHKGAGRRVYPGFIQLTGFMSLDPKRHMSAFANLFRDVARGDERAERTKAFYEEYFAVLDVTAEFYLETLKHIFMDHDLPRGEMHWRGRRVDPSAIRSALLTIEGGKDEMCPPGQTSAAHALCTRIPAKRKHAHVQTDVGHYGVFSGSRFAREIYPRLTRFIADAERRAPAAAAATG
jgi:poly(3-hydroxybutyrate) depolymerase